MNNISKVEWKIEKGNNIDLLHLYFKGINPTKQSILLSVNNNEKEIDFFYVRKSVETEMYILNSGEKEDIDYIKKCRNILVAEHDIPQYKNSTILLLPVIKI